MRRTARVRALRTLGATAVAAMAFGSSAPGARAGEDRPPALREVDIDQRLGEPLPLDLVFRDEEGRQVRLGEYFGKKPVILTLVYYECPMLCTLVLNGLVSALDVLTFDAGRQFEIVTVSIDPGETPELAARKKKEYLERYGRETARQGWHFLTGDEAAIRDLARAAGFRYTYDPATGLFAHGSAIMVATPEGKLARYFYGVQYAPRDLRFAIIEASENRIGSVVDHVLLFCYKYDPATGKYGAAVLNIVRAGGVLTILCLGTYLLVMWRREARAAGASAA